MTNTCLNSLIQSLGMEKKLGRALTWEQCPGNIKDCLIAIGVTSSTDFRNENFAQWVRSNCSEETGVSFIKFVHHIYGKPYLSNISHL